jgi:peroxiredoxin (alkyl hydroperoxide reductase subunit C)
MPVEERNPMTIQVGDSIPSAKLVQGTAEGPKEISTEELFGGKTVVLFGVPGAFTPTCSAKHLPGYVQNFEALKGKGADVVACMAVNDAFVMGAWGKDQAVGDKVVMLADGSQGAGAGAGPDRARPRRALPALRPGGEER